MAYQHSDALFNTALPGTEWTGLKPSVLRAVAQVICHRAYKSTGKCYPSLGDVVEHSQVPRSTAMLALDWLDIFGLFLKEDRTLDSGADTSPMYTVRNVMEVSWMWGGKKRDGIAFQGWCWKEDGSPCGPGEMAVRPPWGISQPQSALEVQGRDHVVDESNPFDRILTFPPESLFVVFEGRPGDPEREIPDSKGWSALPYTLVAPEPGDALRKGGRLQPLDSPVQPLDSPVQLSDREGTAVGLWASGYWTEGGQQLESGSPAIGLKQVKDDTVREQVIRTWKADTSIRAYLLSHHELRVGKDSPFYYPGPKDKEERGGADEEEPEAGEEPEAPVPPPASAGDRRGSCQVPAAQPPPKAASAISAAAPPPVPKSPGPAPAPRPSDPHEDPALRLEFLRTQWGMGHFSHVTEDMVRKVAGERFNPSVAADFDRWLKYRSSPPPPGDPLADREKRLAFIRKKKASLSDGSDAGRYWADCYYRWDDAMLAEFYEFVKTGEPKGPDTTSR